MRCEYAGCKRRAKREIHTNSISGGLFIIHVCKRCYRKYIKAMEAKSDE